MSPQTQSIDFQDFITTYEELYSRFDHDENARALLNDVAVELLSILRRKDCALSAAETRRYFIWLLGKKGFDFKSAFWRDVDLPRHQCERQSVTTVPLDDAGAASDRRFSVDPRKAMADNILLQQAMNFLEEEEKDLLFCRLVEGHTLQEIANRINLTPQGVKKRLDRIYSQVRMHFSNEGALLHSQAP